jgi:chaperone LolA
MKKSLFKIIFSMLLSLGMLMIASHVFAADADDIYGKFKKAYKNMKNFSADFEQTTLVAGKKRTAVGKITFQKPNLLRQEYFESASSQKVTQLIISDGKTLLSYTPMIKQVTKQDFGKNEELFPGFGQALDDVKKNYNLQLVKDEPAEKKGVHCIELTPKKQEEAPMFDAIQVWVRDEDSIPVQVMYRDDKNQATFFFTFQNIKLNDKLDDSVFKFTIPTGVQVITIPGK